MQAIRLFFADDDPDDLELFIEAVQVVDASAKCETADNGEHALQKLRSNLNNVPDYIFLDLNMPRIDGKECLKEIKKIEALKKTPVIIYSTTAAENYVKEAMSLGASLFITKPSSFTVLCDTIRQILAGETELTN